MKSKRHSLYQITAVLSLLLCGVQSVNAESFSSVPILGTAIANNTAAAGLSANDGISIASVGDAFETAITSQTQTQYTMTNDETLSGQLTSGSNTFTITGNSHYITPVNSSTPAGIIVTSDKTLTVNNVVSFNGFTSPDNSGVLDNAGTLNISGTTFSNNSGVVVKNNGSADISSSTFSDNAAIAIDNAAGKTMTVKDTTLSGNNRAINNSGTLNLSNVTVNKGSGSATNDFNQNADGITNFSGTNTIEADITGSGEINNTGTLNLSGNNSGYQGSYKQEQTGAITNVTDGKFFSGTSTIRGGTLNWKTVNDLVESAFLKVSGNSILNIGDDTKNSTLSLSAGSYIADTVRVTIASGSALNVKGAVVTLGSDDNIFGNVAMFSGTMTLNGVTTASELNFSNGNLTIEEGTTNLNGQTTIAESVKTTVNGTMNINGAGSDVKFDSADTVNGKVVLNNSTADLSLNGLDTSGEFDVKLGKLTLSGTNNLSGKTTIAKEVTANVNGTLNINNDDSNVVLDNGDTISNNATIDLQKGSLTLDNITTPATVKAETGSLTLTGTNTLSGVTTVAKEVKAAVSGTLNINNESSNITLDGANDTIASNAVIDLQKGSLTLENITTPATVKAETGSLTLTGTNNLNGVTTIAKEVKTAVSGTLNINNESSNITLDGANDTIADNAVIDLQKGSLTLENITTPATVKAETGSLTLTGTNNFNGVTTIASAVETSLDGTLNLNNAGSNVILDNGDTIADSASVTLKNGNLSINGVTTSGAVSAEAGNLTLTGTNNLNGVTTIASAVETTVNGDLNINNDDSNVVLDNGDTIADSASVTLKNGNLSINGVTTSGAVSAEAGNLTLTGTNTLSGVTTIAKDVATEIKGTLEISNANSQVNINRVDDTQDIWTGAIKLAAGTLNVDGLTSNGTIQATGGTINIESGKLELAGQSYVGQADGNGADVIISQPGTLSVAVDSVIAKSLSGNGKVLVDNSKLTINSDASVDDTLSFESKNNSTVLVNANNNTVDNIVKIVKNGTNSGLTLDIKNNTISVDLNVDGTNIKKLSLAGGEYSGNITNNGTVENTAELLLSGQMSGAGTFNNSANLNVTKDQTGFTGTYNQTAGNLSVSTDGKIFAGDKNITGGTVSVASASGIDYEKVHLSSNTTLTHTSQEGVDNAINKSVVNFVENATGANVVLKDGNYNIEEALGNGKSNSITISNSNVTLGATNYSDGSTYKFENSHLNLIETTDVQTNDYVFDGLTADNSTLSFNVKIVDGATPGSKALETDTITITNNSGTQFKFGNIYITGEENGNPEVYHTVNNVLTNAAFADSPDPDNITYVTGATTSWLYDVETSADKQSITMQVKDYADENTLYNMNNTEGIRFFQFSDDGTNKYDEYHIGESLGETKGPRADGTDAIFNVTGHSRDKNVISGLIESTGVKGSFFDIQEGTKIELNIKDLTIQEADKSGEGSVVYNNSADGKVTITNVGIKNNGGDSAIYNKGELVVSGGTGKSVFEGNTGVVINNIGKASISGSEFKNNTGDTVIANLDEAAQLTVSDTKFEGNSGVVINNIGEATISGSEFKNNTGDTVIANLDAAAQLTVSDTKFEGNSGVVINNIGEAVISGSEFLNNASTAVENSKNMSITGTTLTGNNKAIDNKAGSELTLSGVTVSAVPDSAKNDISNEGNITLKDANNLYSDISGAGNINNTGNVTLTGENSNFTGKYTQASAGAVTNVNDGTFFGGTSEITDGTLNWLTENNIIEDAILTVSGASTTLNVGDNDHSTKLTIQNGSSVADEVKIAIAQNSILEVANNGTVNINGNDIWSGNASVEVSDGILNISERDGNGKLIATGGEVNLNSGSLYITEGSKIAGTDDTTGTNPAVDIKDNTRLVISGGNVTIDNNDTWDGLIKMTSGVLNIDDRTSNKGILHADAGELHFKTGTLTIENGSYIDLDVMVDLPENSIIDILQGGTVAINDNDIWDGEITLNGGVLNYGTTHSGTLTANTGDMNLLSGSILNIQVPSQVADEVNVDIQQNALVNIRDNAKFNLDSKDKWSGMINNAGGTLTTSNLTNVTGSGGGLQQTSGLSIFKDNSNISITDTNSYIRGGDVHILDNSTLYFGAGTSELTVDNLKMEGNSLLNVMNGEIGTSNIGTMEVNGKNNVSINITPREWESDQFVVNNLTSEQGGTVHISDFDFLGYAPIDEHIKLHIFDVNNIQNVDFTTTDKEIFTPIGWYDLKPSGGGYFTSNMVRYNPQVFRGQVATLAMYNNQLALDDMILNHVTLSSERLLAQGQHANQYAILNSQVAPYQYTKEDGGVWFKSYVNFETLSLNRGLHVNNTAYGSVVGADFPVMNLDNGWEFIPTAYLSYNGSNQSFHGVDMTQNGGQLGVMGTFMKNDIVASILAYGGGYNNEMSVAGYTDHTGNWFAGAAGKVAYNMHATEHFTVQPSAFVSYNAFGKQNWNTDFGTMSMNSSLMNGVNVAPGVNFIYARETWNLYTAIQYMININEHVDGRAGNVDLQNVDMKHGYLQYAFGFNKTWKDRMSSYGQVTVRNGGRTGVGFQLGLQYLFDMKNVHKVKHNPGNGIVNINSDMHNEQSKNVIKSL